jgi:hypothetical protein
MRIDQKTAAGIARLAGALPNQARVLELAMLAGNGLAAPLAGVRANQARREAVRAQLKFGARSPELAHKLAEAEAASRLVESIDAEIARLSIEPPLPKQGDVAVYGYVRDSGKPVSGVTVALVDKEGDSKIEGRTGKDGSFSLSGPGPGPFGLAVRKGNSMVLSDKDQPYSTSPRPYYRVVEDAGDHEDKPARAAPGKPHEQPETPKRGRSPYSGLTLNQALVKLADDGRRLSHVKITPTKANHSLHVIDATRDSRSGAVTLEMAVGEGHSDRLDILAVLMVQGSAGEQLGLTSIEQARELLRGAQLESLDQVGELLALSDDTIARKSGIRRGAQAKSLREALESGIKLIEIG